MLEIATRPLEIEIFMNKFAISWRDFSTQYFFQQFIKFEIFCLEFLKRF